MMKLSECKQYYCISTFVELWVLHFFLLLCIVKKLLLNTQSVKQVIKDNFDKDLMQKEVQTGMHDVLS